MKNVAVFLFICVFSVDVFAGGKVDSGRSSTADTVEAGQFAGPDKIDAYAYINDYNFPYEMDKTADLTVYAKLEKNTILTIGDTFNLLVGLQVNNKEYFKRNEGNYIIFLHNPSILLRDEWKKSIIAVLTKIRREQKSNGIIGIYSSITNEIIQIPTTDSISSVLNKIQNTRKAYALDTILDQSFKCMDAIENDMPTRFIWITDSDLLKSNNAARERDYFDYLMKLQSQNNISFSYIGYGEVPDWSTMNQSLKNVGGNSYFIENNNGLEKELWEDYDRFVFPTIENIKVNVSLMPWITESRSDFRKDWYPVNNFRPTNTYYTQTQTNEIKSMDAGEHKLFLHYLNITSENKLANNQYFRDVYFDNKTIPVGFCSVEYYSYAQGKTVYRSLPLELKYTEYYADYDRNINRAVQKYTILQNTGFILKELSQLVNSRQYYIAILLIDSQIKLLEKYQKEIFDEKIMDDIDVLNKNKELLMQQARSLNYIR